MTCLAKHTALCRSKFNAAAEDLVRVSADVQDWLLFDHH